jgi:hypothetical protein
MEGISNWDRHFDRSRDKSRIIKSDMINVDNVYL